MIRGALVCKGPGHDPEHSGIPIYDTYGHHVLITSGNRHPHGSSDECRDPHMAFADTSTGNPTEAGRQEGGEVDIRSCVQPLVELGHHDSDIPQL